MNRFLVAAAVLSAASFFEGPARAAPCSVHWPATAEVGLAATVMKKGGAVTYIEGWLERITLTVPRGGGSWTRWTSSGGSTRAYDVQIGGTIRPAGAVTVQIVKSTPPSILVREANGRSRSFAGTCSPSGLVHGTAGDMDILVNLSRIDPPR